jgi:hypothetical protein
LDASESVRVALQELRERPAPLVVVAAFTGDGEVADAVRPALAPWVDVLDLEWHVLLVAVGALPLELLQEVLAHLLILHVVEVPVVTGQLALLVFDPADLRILLLLKVEAHQLLRQRRDRDEAHQPPHPGLHVRDPAFEAGREPTLPSRPVVEAGLAVASVAGPSAAARGPSGFQGRPDVQAAVFDLDCRDDPAGLLLNNGDSGCPRARVDLHPMRVDDGILQQTIFQDDGERVAPEHGGASPGQQDPSPGW